MLPVKMALWHSFFLSLSHNKYNMVSLDTLDAEKKDILNQFIVKLNSLLNVIEL